MLDTRLITTSEQHALDTPLGRNGFESRHTVTKDDHAYTVRFGLNASKRSFIVTVKPFTTKDFATTVCLTASMAVMPTRDGTPTDPLSFHLADRISYAEYQVEGTFDGSTCKSVRDIVDKIFDEVPFVGGRLEPAYPLINLRDRYGFLDTRVRRKIDLNGCVTFNGEIRKVLRSVRKLWIDLDIEPVRIIVSRRRPSTGLALRNDQPHLRRVA